MTKTVDRLVDFQIRLP